MSANPPPENLDSLLDRLATLATASLERAETMRQILQQAVATKNFMQVRIAQVLTEVHEHGYWRDWGFASFKEFVEKDCPFQLRKAQQMIAIYKQYVEVLGIPLERLQSIEWTKAALVAPIITAENSIEWLKKLESLSFRELKQIVDRHRQSKVVCNLGPMAPSHKETGTPSPIRVASSDWRMERPNPNDFWVTEENWEQLCYAIHFGVNSLLLGDSGCGKTELAYRIAKAADRRLEAFNFGAMSEARSSLIGNTHLNGNGTRFQKSRFVSTVEAANSILLLDELSRAGRDAFNILFPLLDDQGYLALDESESAEVVQRAPGVAFLGTANVGPQYTGTEALDLALLDRFPITISVDWPLAEQEIAILMHRSPGLDRRDAARLVKIANEQRSRAREGEFVGMISTRSLIAAAKQIAAGISFERAFRYCILSKFSNEGGDTSERARLLQILQKIVK